MIDGEELEGYSAGIVPPYIEQAHDEMAFSCKLEYTDLLSPQRYEYHTKAQKQLVEKCHEYVAQRLGGTNGDGSGKALLMVTHPFYEDAMREAGERDEAEGTYQERLAAYEDNLQKLLSEIDRDRFDVVLLEVPEHFAYPGSRSRQLVDEHLVDDVVFTHYSEGSLLKDEVERVVSGYDAYLVAGAYGEYCAQASLDTVPPDGTDRRYAVTDALLSYEHLHNDEDPLRSMALSYDDTEGFTCVDEVLSDKLDLDTGKVTGRERGFARALKKAQEWAED
ncbi:MAG: hypothetical protein QF415_10390 [Candidatus Undinarchaeales archaeon]|jgi:hypothetical protein|nr:hypothetical protein [Candidatus Undinarchaeales archaeon]MDP7494399.1 hypothetical protein [Candidatus Undinarchaeales archaeon]